MLEPGNDFEPDESVTAYNDTGSNNTAIKQKK